MAFGSGNATVELKDILARTTEADIVSYYLGIKTIPSVISSPFRVDKTPSFGIYSNNGVAIHYIDFSTRERGGLFDLLMKLWKCSFPEALERVNKDLSKFSTNKVDCSIKNSSVPIKLTNTYSRITELKCKTREWRDYDVEYWASYGISLKWLKYAEVYPISHKIIIRENQQYVFGTDKYAYAYVERKEGRITLKIYQPFNKRGFKWCSNIDRSVWGLWTKIPKFGDNLIISSSVKDCLNIMCNLKIPAICMQSEGHKPKPRVIEELKNRYKNIILFYDNDYNNPDNPGRKDSIELSLEYNLKRVEIPAKYEAKDPSDLFKKYGKDRYLEIMNEILKDVLWKSGEV